MKISELPTAERVTNDDFLPLVQSGETKKANRSQILEGVPNGITQENGVLHLTANGEKVGEGVKLPEITVDSELSAESENPVQNKTVTKAIKLKANTDGYYENMAVGTADNLAGKGDGVGAQFIYRTSGGTADIADGTATINCIYGNTIVSNGELLNFNAVAVKSVGYNSWNGTSAKVIANKVYRIEGAFTDVTLNGAQITVTDREFIPSENGTVTVSGADDTTCLHLVWTGVRNGEYEPYWEQIRALPITEYFPDGMKSAGTAYDELTKYKAVKRIGVVDLGTLNWTKNSNGYFYAQFNQAVFSQNFNSVKSNLLCAKYETKTYAVVVTKTEDKVITAAGTTRYIYIYDSEYESSTAAAFKEALSGVLLHYEMKEVVKTEIAPALNLSYRVSDFGTEEIIAEKDTSQIVANIVYGMNATDTLRRLPTMYISKASLDDFCAALGKHFGVTVTAEYQENLQKYHFTVSEVTE